MAIYGAWFLLIWFHAWIPWWAMILGGYVIAWQFTLQHETIRGVPAWFRTLIAMRRSACGCPIRCTGAQP